MCFFSEPYVRFAVLWEDDIGEDGGSGYENLDSLEERQSVLSKTVPNVCFITNRK